MVIYMRHAKSAYPLGVADHDRPLNPRGRKNAGIAAAWFSTQDVSIDIALVSTATRTRQTWDILEAALECPVKFSPELYLAPATLIQSLVEDTAGNVLVLAHNPGIHEAAMLATGQQIARFPTSAFAVVVAGALEDFVIPR